MKRFRKLKRPVRVTATELSTALDHIRSRVTGEISLKSTLKEFEDGVRARRQGLATDEEILPTKIKMASALFDTGRLTKAEYVFQCGYPLVSLHDKQFIDGRYDTDLAPISERMDAIRKQYGLAPDEDWLVSDFPVEYALEDKKYEAILNEKEGEVFCKFAPPALLSLFANDADEFWKLYERGRRSVFDASDHLASIIDLIEMYEGEAAKCAAVEAYYAANAMLGSASEARILLECLRQPTKAKAIVRKLPSKRRPRKSDPLDWTLNNLIDVATLAGWLPNIDDEEVVHVVSGWAHRLRTMRNFLHPGRHVLDRPHAHFGKEEWLDAWSAYTAMRHSIEMARKKVHKRSIKSQAPSLS
jgi:hypothetical protein